MRDIYCKHVRICSDAPQHPAPRPAKCGGCGLCACDVHHANKNYHKWLVPGTASCRRRHNTVKKCDKDAAEVVYTVKTLEVS